MRIRNFQTIVSAAWIASSALGIGPSTNRFYVTFEPKTTFQEKTNFSPQEISKASLAPESRPAEADPEGHWGAASEGFQLSICVPKRDFTNGEPVAVQMFLRNVTNKPLYYPISSTGLETVLTLRKGNQEVRRKDAPKDNSFSERVRAAKQGSEAFWVMSPGTQRQFSLDLSRIFDLQVGEYSVHATRRVTNYERTAKATVASGVAQFKIAPEKGSNPVVPDPQRESHP